MTLPKEEADALRRCLSILAPMHPAHERRTMALGIEKRISGQETALLALRYVQIAALFYPSEAKKAHEFTQQLQAAADNGELVTAISPEQKGALISDLAAWPGCPPIPEESPLRYWLPYMPTPEVVQATQSAPPRILKKSAMVATYLDKWPTIDADINEAARNGLAVAKTGKKGMWNVDKAIEWARSKGKWLEPVQAHPIAAAWPGAATKSKTGN